MNNEITIFHEQKNFMLIWILTRNKIYPYLFSFDVLSTVKIPNQMIKTLPMENDQSNGSDTGLVRVH